MPGFSQRGGLQLVDSFAHDSPADAEVAHDFGFGWQFGAGLELAFSNAASQAVDDFSHQATGTARFCTFFEGKGGQAAGGSGAGKGF